MQFFALTAEEEVVEASLAERKKDYICMECKGLVRVRQGELRRSHFYHYKESLGCRQAGKSLEHLQTQLFLKEFIEGVIELEKAFPSISRIADAVHEEKKIIFEVQCSPILAQEVKERNADYGRLGYQVIWILHDKRYGANRMSSAEHFLQRSPHYYTDIDCNGKGCIYDRTWADPRRVIEVEGSIVKVKPFAKVPQAIKLRGAKWQVRLKGDLFDHISSTAVKRESFWDTIKKAYRILLQTAVESASR